MKIRQIMSKPALHVSPETKVGTVARLMADKGVSGVPVVDDSGKVVGIVTQSDLVVRNANIHFPHFLQFLDARIYLEGTKQFDEEVRRMMGNTAADLMTSPCIVVDADDEIERAATIMMEKHIHALPVLEKGKLVGVITQADMVRLIADEERS
ncbi:MAG TPA: CBS domain-containing protein [Chloroflexota bacterium]|nr:CBS domain-containing protein [Chloroflexota bacterium]